MNSSVYQSILEAIMRPCVQTTKALPILDHATIPTTVGPLGDSPVQIACPNCHQIVLSKVDYSAGLLTYIFCGGLFFCCCLIPFCVDRLKDAKHTCPICKTVLGVYKRL
uniref:Lipopolysaccharide-induced TNF factor n=1 Tax=Haplochromis burtoni TaxID=8153 RepID=A0A3Q3BSF5_HAPBU